MTFDDIAALTIHDVKNRLAVLAGRAEAAGDRDTLHAALESAATLSRLLLLYKTEKSQVQLAVDARVPADLLQELALEISRQTPLTVNVDEQAASVLAFYDEALVRMVLLNALYNALRYARSTVTLSTCEQPGWLEFRVDDDGPGFPPEVLAAQTAIKPLSDAGTGLGLYLADQVARLHRHGERAGRIALANTAGARFSLFLPQ